MSHPPPDAPLPADALEAAAWRRKSGLLSLITLRWRVLTGAWIIAWCAVAWGARGPRLGAMLAVVLVGLGGNAALVQRLQRGARVSRAALTLSFVVDIANMALWLTLAAPSARPFVVCTVVYMALAALLLEGAWLWLLELVHATAVVLLVAPDHRAAGLLQAPGALALCGATLVSTRLMCIFVPKVAHALCSIDARLNQAHTRAAQKEQLEALATLAAGAAHELSPPLASISDATRTLERQLARHDAPVVLKDDLVAMRREIERARGILQQLVDDAGASIAEPAHPIAAVELVAAALAGLAGGSRVRVLVAPGAEEAMVQVPKRSLARSVRALVNNALEAVRQREQRTSSLSHAAQSAPPVEVFVERTAQQCHVVVRDRGAGMSAQVLARATEPFFSTKGPGRGMGLGLFLARRVLERLGGGLEVHSRVGVGTTVTLQMPVVELSVLPRRGRHGIAPYGQEDGFPYGPERGAEAHASLG